MSTIFEALNNSSLISEISAIPDLSARNLTENVEGMMNCGVEMQMSFTGGYKATFLFQSFMSESVSGFFGYCVLTFVFTFLLPLLNYLRRILLVSHCMEGGCKARNMTKNRIISTFISFVQGMTGAFLMLIWMTYNVWVLLSASLGLALGYFVFESKFDGFSQPTQDTYQKLQTSEIGTLANPQ